MYVSHSLATLLEWVRASAPPGQEQRQTDSLEDTGQSADRNRIERAFLSEDLGDELASH